MSLPLKLFFDQCCSPQLRDDILRLFAIDHPEMEAGHVRDFYAENADDSVWLEPLKNGWLVVTCDRGCDNSKEKLPVICKEWGITHIAFSNTLIKRGYKMQKMAILAVWPQVLHLHRLPKGTQVKLGCAQERGGVDKFQLRVNGKSIDSLLI